jgi:hypothetical protein
MDPRFRAEIRTEILVQRVATALERPADYHCRVELRKLGLQLLVDQQQRPQRTMDVAIATGHDLVDGGFI